LKRERRSREEKLREDREEEEAGEEKREKRIYYIQVCLHFFFIRKLY
jgi:hypothetical protein